MTFNHNFCLSLDSFSFSFFAGFKAHPTVNVVMALVSMDCPPLPSSEGGKRETHEKKEARTYI